MNTTRPNSLIALMIVFLTLLSLAPAYSAAAENNSMLSKKDLKELLANAKTPAEHQKIATYYRQKAQRLNDSSKQHSELAATYAKNPPFAALEAKHGIAFGQGATHCRYWAKRDAEEATKAEAIAARHEALAKAAEQKPGL
jgi:hypothetical protein